MTKHERHRNASAATYEPPATEVIGSLRSLTQQKGGAEVDSIKGIPDSTDFPSGFAFPGPQE